MKQAVVLIHGIGEQKPMDTLRGFVSAVLPKAERTEEQYWSKPDSIAEIFELRRLQSRGRTATHFFEYYWAYHVEGTKLRHLGEWLFSLLRRRKRDVPLSLQPIWRSSRIIVLSLILLAAFGALGHLYAWFVSMPRFGALWFAAFGVLGILQYSIVHYLGDAARYLSPHPLNITLRQKIRAEGLRLLRELHKSRDYDRIIVVGHSLGSVIGYDIISRLWQEHNDVVKNPKPHRQPALHKIPNVAGTLLKGGVESVQRFRELQHQLWLEQKELGNTWRITDFITLGSPLSHAMLLLARSSDEFEMRKRQRELPTCPPVCDEKKGYSYVREPPFELNGQKFSLSILHHAAPFAVTRWTNVYFPAKAGLFGDFIGGPLQQVLGSGIEDVPVTSGCWKGWARFTPVVHTKYWAQESPPTNQPQRGSGMSPSLQALIEALDLGALRKFR